MISNTDLFYQKAQEYQDKRKEIEDVYESSLKALERFKGSKGYEEDLRKLNKKHEEELQSLQEEYRPEFNVIISGMMDAIGKRPVKAPTNDQVNLLNVLKMRKAVTLEECQQVAYAVKDCPLAVRIIDEIAREHNLHESFLHLCAEMPSVTASEIVTSMRRQLDDFLKYDTSKASRLAKQHHEDLFGSAAAPLIKRQLFSDKEGAFRAIAGLDGDELKKFSDIVDA